MRILSLLRSGMVVSIADRPHRLVGYANAGQGSERHVGQSRVELPVEQRFSLMGLTLLQGLADAQDHVEA